MKKVSPGDRFEPTARDWNRLADLANARPGSSIPAPGRFWAYSWVWVRNDSGADWPRAYACELSTVLTAGESKAGDPIFSGDAPTLGTGSSSDGLGYVPTSFVAVTLEPIKDGKIGRAIISGPCRVKIRNAPGEGLGPVLADLSRKESSGDSPTAGQLSVSWAGRFTVFPCADVTGEAETWAVLHGFSQPLLRVREFDAALALSHTAFNAAKVDDFDVDVWLGHLLDADLPCYAGLECWGVGRAGRAAVDVVAFGAPWIPAQPTTTGKKLTTTTGGGLAWS